MSSYSTIWILEPPLLTMISMCLLIFALVDYLVPTLTSFLCNAQSWTGQKEKKLIEICQSLSDSILEIQRVWASLSRIRHNRPNLVCENLFTSCTLQRTLDRTPENKIHNNFALINRKT